MARTQQQQFSTIRTEGALLPPDVLQQIASGKAEGLRPADYHLPEGYKLNEAITQSWDLLKKHWKTFQEARAGLSDTDTGTEITNKHWLLPLFRELDYGHLATSPAPQIEDRSYPIERFYNHTPIHLVGCNLPLDRRTKGARGAATASPHSMVQEFLNRSEGHVWAIVTNGLRLRLLRDNVALSRQAFVEFDLEAMMEGEVYPDFALLWLLLHQSRVEAPKPDDCWLETWSKLARESGTRILKQLRESVRTAIEALGQGFIAHVRNDELREQLRSGTLSRDDYYRQLLRIVYRLLFLFVAEDRDLLHPPGTSDTTRDRYRRFYSLSRLRDMALKLRGSKHGDLWHGLSLVFKALGSPDGCQTLGLSGLGSFLWTPEKTPDLNGPHEAADGRTAVQIANDDLLLAIRALAYVEQDGILRSVDYRNLGSEELGSVYESLLELHPDIEINAQRFSLATAAGNQRKTSGSYYTPDSLVQCLLDSALDPVVEDRIKGKKGPDAEAAILDLTVCDPACGSGHFLIAAAHRLARHVARIRTGESEPSPDDHQTALRDVISRCIYGVDLNPMAVELCKVSLWMEAIEPGKPLSFLDHHVKCGNSLLGVTPRLLREGIPEDAFKPIEADDKDVVKDLKKRHKQELKDRTGGVQSYLFAPYLKLGNLGEEFVRVTTDPGDTAADVARKASLYADLVARADYLNAKLLADTWCSSFVWKKDKTDLGKACPTERDYRDCETNPHSLLPQVRTEVARLAEEFLFFHWHLAFPEVFCVPVDARKPENEQMGWDGGFDVMLGNPPWELVAADSNKEATRRFAGEQAMLKANEYSILNGRRDLYKVFFVRAPLLVGRKARLGFLLPLGLFVEDDSTNARRAVFDSGSVVRLRHFQNHRKEFFSHVHASYRFCEFTYTPGDFQPHEFSTVARGVADLSKQVFFLVQRSSFDKYLGDTRSAVLYTEQRHGDIHRRLVNSMDTFGRAPLNVVAEFHASSDKALIFFPQREATDWALPKNRTIHQYNYRFCAVEAFASRASVIERLERKSLPIDLWLTQLPRLAFRDIARNDDERSLIASLLPPGFVSTYDTPMALPELTDPESSISVLKLLCGTFNSFLGDYAIRPYVDKHIKGYTLNRVPWPAWPSGKHQVRLSLVCRSVEELSSLKPPLHSCRSPRGVLLPSRTSGARRKELRATIDAAIFHLYGINRDDVDYIMDTFPIVKRKDVAKYGSYRTKERILAIYDEMAECIAKGTEWVSPLDPPPGDPRAAWTEEEMEMWRQGKGDELIAKYGLLDDADEPDDSDADSESEDPADAEAEAVE
jgi:hypothetical protein